MGLGKKTIKMVEKLLEDPVRRSQYSRKELEYMEKQLPLLKEQRRIRKEARDKQRRTEKGFSND